MSYDFSRTPSPLSHLDSVVTMNLYSHQWKISQDFPFFLLLLLLELLKLNSSRKNYRISSKKGVDLGTLGPNVECGAQHLPINSLLQHPLNCNCSYESGWCYLIQYRRSCTRMSR